MIPSVPNEFDKYFESAKANVLKLAHECYLTLTKYYQRQSVEIDFQQFLMSPDPELGLSGQIAMEYSAVDGDPITIWWSTCYCYPAGSDYLLEPISGNPPY